MIDGFKKYGIMGALVAAVSFIAFYIGLSPFDRQPSIEKALVEGVVYYIWCVKPAAACNSKQSCMDDRDGYVLWNGM